MIHVKPSVIAEATTQALCDPGYLHHRDHIDFARAHGLPAANGALRASTTRMQQQPALPLPQPMQGQ